MNKEVIGLIVGTIVIFLSFVFVWDLSFLYLRSEVGPPCQVIRTGERLSAIAVS